MYNSSYTLKKITRFINLGRFELEGNEAWQYLSAEVRVDSILGGQMFRAF
jgi:hypothetical protein